MDFSHAEKESFPKVTSCLQHYPLLISWYPFQALTPLQTELHLAALWMSVFSATSKITFMLYPNNQTDTAPHHILPAIPNWKLEITYLV